MSTLKWFFELGRMSMRNFKQNQARFKTCALRKVDLLVRHLFHTWMSDLSHGKSTWKHVIMSRYNVTLFQLGDVREVARHDGLSERELWAGQLFEWIFFPHSEVRDKCSKWIQVAFWFKSDTDHQNGPNPSTPVVFMQTTKLHRDLHTRSQSH